MPTNTAAGIARPAHSVGPWPADLCHLLPDPVREASDALTEALERQAAAGADTREAREAVAVARDADSEAAISAADKGETPPKPTRPKAEAKLAEAECASEALQVVVTRRQEAFLVAVRVSHGTLRAALGDELARIATGVDADLDRIEAGLTQAATLQGALRELGDDADHLAGRGVRFMPPIRRRDRQRDPLRRGCRQHLEALREAAR